MAESKKGDRVRVAIDISVNLDKEVTNLAKNSDRTKAKIVRNALDLYLAIDQLLNQDPANELAVVKDGKVVKTIVLLYR